MNEVAESLLKVRGLTKVFSSGLFSQKRKVYAVRGVDMDIAAGATFGLVGESGSGKTTVGRLIARLIDATSGTIEFDGYDFGAMEGSNLRLARRDMQVIFQDPLRSLNPRMTVRQLIEEPFRLHGFENEAERTKLVLAAVEEVGLSESALSRFPHEFSGGQRQRIAIARALALKPKLIVADEPTSSLDVSVQAQVLNLMKRLQKQHGVAYLFISHDLNVVRFMSDQIGVMYLGELVEVGSADAVFTQPKHPYTRSLLEAVPTIHDSPGRGELSLLKGEPPTPTELIQGCPFSSRCPDVLEVCRTVAPPVVQFEYQLARCHLYGGESGVVLETHPIGGLDVEA